MALLRHLASRKILPNNPAMLLSASRQASYWVEDDMPKPYPKTQKERLEAAKRYGLLPHEYEPYPDDGMGKGDYPHLPDIGADSKDPNYPWDYPEYRKNYGECWHAHADVLGEDRCDPKKDWQVSHRTMLMYLFGTIAAAFGIVYLLDPYPLHRPVCKKQYPKRGTVHYSFERGN